MGRYRVKGDMRDRLPSVVLWFVPGGGQTHYRGYLLEIQRFPRHTDYSSGTIRDAGNLTYVYSI